MKRYLIMPEQPNKQGYYTLKYGEMHSGKAEKVIAKFSDKKACRAYAEDYIKGLKHDMV